MTLIASFKSGAHPCLLSDCLISRQAIPGSRIHLPLFGEVALASEGTGSLDFRFPCSMMQKTVIVGGDLAIAWAGVVSIATDVVANIRERHLSKAFTNETLSRHLDGLPKGTWDDVSLVGYLAMGNSKEGATLFQFWRGVDGVQLPTTKFGHVAAAGSGTRHLFRTLHHMGGLEPIRGDMGEARWEYGVVMASTIVGSLLGEERATQATLEAGFGGGYEITLFVGGRFQKVSGQVYMFWEAEKLDDGEIQVVFNSRGVISKYFGDVLVLRPFPIREEDPEKHAENVLYPISPSYREVEEEDLKAITLPLFDSALFIHVVDMAKAGFPNEAFGIADLSKDNGYVRIQEEDHRDKPAIVDVAVSSRFVDLISNAVASRSNQR